MQDLETSLDSAVVRTGSSVAVAENTGAVRSVPAHLAQFAEAQRIIVLDVIRTDLLQPDASPESSGSMHGAMNGESALQCCRLCLTHAGFSSMHVAMNGVSLAVLLPSA